MPKIKIIIEKISDNECKVLANNKSCIFKGNDAVIIMSLHNNNGQAIPEELLGLAIRNKKPLPKITGKFLSYLKNNNNL